MDAPVVVVAATDRPDVLDPAILRSVCATLKRSLKGLPLRCAHHLVPFRPVPCTAQPNPNLLCLVLRRLNLSADS